MFGIPEHVAAKARKKIWKYVLITIAVATLLTIIF